MSYVYVMKNHFDVVKVGKSNNPEQRRADIQSSSGIETTLVYFQEGEHLETLTHEILSEYRTFGEWFNCTTDQAIAAIKKAEADYDKEIQKELEELKLDEEFDKELYKLASMGSSMLSKDQLDYIKETALNRLIEHAGSKAHLCRMLDITIPTLQGWVERKQVSKNGAKMIESHPTLGLRFKAKYFRPDIN